MKPGSIVKRTAIALSAAASFSAATMGEAAAQTARDQADWAAPGSIEIAKGLSLRHMVLRNDNAKATVLLLHGFPETLYTWEHLSRELSTDFEVHAFDWPGYGLSSRPSADGFAYAPRDYARVLKQYVAKAGIKGNRLIIYATDIGALPALLAAVDDPRIARAIIVGDFAPFNRPQYMHERLQRLKAKPSSDIARAELNAGRDDTLENAFKRGLPIEAQFALSRRFRDDMASGWNHGEISSADAFYHYYSHFGRDQDFLEANLKRLKTPVRVLWGAEDIYIRQEMGVEFAGRTGSELTVLPGVGHYAHLQAPEQVAREIRAALP